MASSPENLMSNIDPLAFMRPTHNDYWLSELLSRDAETLTLTRALQKSLQPVLHPAQPQAQTPTVSGLSGSDPDTPVPSSAAAPKRHRNAVSGGKVAKRKPRAPKRSQTTFITADAANFRQMVQQVTGVRFGGGASAAAAAFPSPIIKPEPLRGFGSAGVGAGFPLGGGAYPPTLDTSALLLDRNRSPAAEAPAEAVTCPQGIAASFVYGDGLDFDAFQSFPTLESWKVM